MNITFQWDPYPDQTFDGWRIYVSPTFTDWVLLKTITPITVTSTSVAAPAFGNHNYALVAFKGAVESPRSASVPVEFTISAPTGFQRVA